MLTTPAVVKHCVFLEEYMKKTFVPALPYLLSFAAGAMLYVVVEELIPVSARFSLLSGSAL